jgi:hypothetical protein
MGDHEDVNHEHRGSKAQPLCMNADTHAHAHTQNYLYMLSEIVCYFLGSSEPNIILMSLRQLLKHTAARTNTTPVQHPHRNISQPAPHHNAPP